MASKNREITVKKYIQMFGKDCLRYEKINNKIYCVACDSKIVCNQKSQLLFLNNC